MKRSLFLLSIALLTAACVAPAAKMPDSAPGSMSKAAGDQADAYLHFMNGSMLEQEGSLDAAMKEYEAAFRLDPGSAEVAHALASLSLHRGKIEDAVSYAQMAVTIDPKRTETLMLLAGINSGRKKYSEAIELYRKVIAIDPALEDAYIYLGSLYA